MNWWSGKRVLVTGAGGFLGHHVSNLIAQLDCEYWFLKRTDGDLTEQRACGKLFDAIKPHVVIHLAAECGGIGANQKRPGEFFYANMQMGLNVLECARVFDVEKLVMLGTTCAYPKYTTIPFVETDFWCGYPEATNAPYGVAKRALMVGAEAYRKEYGLNVITLVPTNLYGEWDSFDPEDSHVIPALIRKFLDAKTEAVTLWGSGKPTRDFLYAGDAASAIVRAAQSGVSGGVFNLGSGREVSVAEIAALCAGLCDFRGRIEWDLGKPDGQPRRCLDSSLAKKTFGWEATTPLDEGLKRTIEWYRHARRAA